MNTGKKWDAAMVGEQLFCYCGTPVGLIRITEDSLGICAVTFMDSVDTPRADWGKGVYLAEARSQLLEYFAGTRRAFDLPLSVHGSAFQERVWNALRGIPYGETRSYQQIAGLVGSGKAARAVGMANHRNPLPILIPCHRVVGKDGALVGYAGGLERKRYLLDLELARGR